jgi:hypothetical protein
MMGDAGRGALDPGQSEGNRRRGDWHGTPRGLPTGWRAGAAAVDEVALGAAALDQVAGAEVIASRWSPVSRTMATPLS